MESSSQISQGPSGGNAGEEAKRAQEDEMRHDLMATVLDTAARERLARIALVSPDRSRQIESIIMRLAQTGQLRGRVSEEQLIELLEQAEEAQSKSSVKKTTIVYQRRKDFDDDFDI